MISGKCVEENVSGMGVGLRCANPTYGELDGLIKLHILGNFDITRVCGFLAFAAAEIA